VVRLQDVGVDIADGVLLRAFNLWLFLNHEFLLLLLVLDWRRFIELFGVLVQSVVRLQVVRLLRVLLSRRLDFDEASRVGLLWHNHWRWRFLLDDFLGLLRFWRLLNSHFDSFVLIASFKTLFKFPLALSFNFLFIAENRQSRELVKVARWQAILAQRRQQVLVTIEYP